MKYGGWELSVNYVDVFICMLKNIFLFLVFSTIYHCTWLLTYLY